MKENVDGGNQKSLTILQRQMLAVSVCLLPPNRPFVNPTIPSKRCLFLLSFFSTLGLNGQCSKPSNLGSGAKK